MSEELFNNTVTLIGEQLSEPVFSHEVFKEGFFDFRLGVKRLSGQIDVIPITISERIIDKEAFMQGNTLKIYGQFRSYNKLDNGRSRLMLTVFAREYELMPDDAEHKNDIQINGYICRRPIYRVTPFKREICDVLIAVNRAYNKSDYIPCIAWGRNARFVSNAEIGDKLFISGRIQSREYQKCYENNEVETKVAYEVSVNRLAVNNEFADKEYVDNYDD